jgi:hypothetical protein
MAHLDIANSATAFLLYSPVLGHNINIVDDMHIYGTAMLLLQNQTILRKLLIKPMDSFWSKWNTVF